MTSLIDILSLWILKRAKTKARLHPSPPPFPPGFTRYFLLPPTHLQLLLFTCRNHELTHDSVFSQFKLLAACMAVGMLMSLTIPSSMMRATLARGTNPARRHSYHFHTTFCLIEWAYK